MIEDGARFIVLGFTGRIWMMIPGFRPPALNPAPVACELLQTIWPVLIFMSQTWMDPQTGLEWQCESPGVMTWLEAQEYAKSLLLDGKKGWRVPAAVELESLLDRSTLLDRVRPLMREDVPFRDTRSYWSSTTFSPNTYSAWIVMFDGAYVLSYYKTNFYHVRCVRNAAGR